MHGWAQAAPIHTFGGIRSVADSLKLVERAQYIWNGRRYWGPGLAIAFYGRPDRESGWQPCVC